jgi:hypothetical protein
MKFFDLLMLEYRRMREMEDGGEGDGRSAYFN